MFKQGPDILFEISDYFEIIEVEITRVDCTCKIKQETEKQQKVAFAVSENNSYLHV